MKKFIQFISLISILTIISSTPVFSQGCVEATSDEGPQLVGYIQPEFGYYFFHEDYVKLKMMGFTVHKDAVKKILKKF